MIHFKELYKIHYGTQTGMLGTEDRLMGDEQMTGSTGIITTTG